MARTITQLVIHCSAEPMGRVTNAATIRQWHLNQGYRDIGYHHVIKADGTVEPGRPEDQVGAHVEGHNSNSIGICLIGGLDPATWQPSDKYTDAQWTSLIRLLTDLRKRYPGTEILGHRDFPKVAKACPCFDAKPWAKSHGF